MPPKRKSQAAPKGGSQGRKMPPPLPSGVVFTDLTKNQWVLGQSVGKGGFGEIYLARKKAAKEPGYVIKVEPHENGPLFSELAFYQRAAKPDMITRWVQERKLKYLPIPMYIGSGLHEHETVRYRFLVMERFGDDVEKLFCKNGKMFGIKTVCYLALQMLEALEYLHSHEYVHADIKGSNILTGYGPHNVHKVYLVDYGLAYRYNPDGVHKEYHEDPRRCHDGTIEYTSIDAHKGANCSRRSDLEILGYCLLHWASGRLPWENCLTKKPQVADQKERYKSKVKELMTACFDGPATPSCLEQYMKSVYSLSYTVEPNYAMLKSLFKDELKSRGMKDDGAGLDWVSGSSLVAGSKRKHGTTVNDVSKKAKSDAAPRSGRVRKGSAGTSKKVEENKEKEPEKEEEEKEEEVEEEIDLSKEKLLSTKKGRKEAVVRKRKARSFKEKLERFSSASENEEEEEEEEVVDSDSDEYIPPKYSKRRQVKSPRKVQQQKTKVTLAKSAGETKRRGRSKVATESSVTNISPLQAEKAKRVKVSVVRISSTSPVKSEDDTVCDVEKEERDNHKQSATKRKILLAKKESPKKLPGEESNDEKGVSSVAIGKRRRQPAKRPKSEGQRREGTKGSQADSDQVKIPKATYPAQLGYKGES